MTYLSIISTSLSIFSYIHVPKRQNPFQKRPTSHQQNLIRTKNVVMKLLHQKIFILPAIEHNIFDQLIYTIFIRHKSSAKASESFIKLQQKKLGAIILLLQFLLQILEFYTIFLLQVRFRIFSLYMQIFKVVSENEQKLALVVGSNIDEC